MEMVTKILKNRIFWYVVIGIILFFIIRRNWYKIKRFFLPRDVDFQPGESIIISEARKSQLQNFAQQLYNDIHHTPITGHNEGIYDAIAASVTDNELVFLSGYYRQFLSPDESLFEALGDEYYTFTSPDQIQARLLKIGEGA